MHNSIRISASIVLYNTNKVQLKTVIESYVPSANRFLYLIDNSPTRENIETVYKNKNIQYHFVGKNIGYGAGHNIAITMAIGLNTQYHVILNPDLQFDPQIIDKIADFMDADSSIGQVMPKIINPNGEIQYLCKLIPTPVDLFFKRFLPRMYFHKISDRFQLKFTSYNEQMNVPYLSGCFMFFRLSALKDIGLFDERFFMYPEDIDITRRMHRLYKTLYYPSVSVIHEHASESYKNSKMFFIHIMNMIKYFNKWGWLFDKEREEINKNVLNSLGYK